MIKLFKLDKNNFKVGAPLFIDTDEIIPTGYTDVQFPVDENGQQVPLYKPKLVDGKWVEGKTEEEFLEDALLTSLNPSTQEIAKAERELETIELLIEMGVI